MPAWLIKPIQPERIFWPSAYCRRSFVCGKELWRFTMVQLNLNEEERQTLLYMLENCISNLKEEIHETDRADYKEMLKHRKDVLHKLWLAMQPESQPTN